MSGVFGVFLSTFATMIVIVDPPGNLPVFMSLTASYDRAQRTRVAWQSNVLALAILLVFGFFGSQLFSAMGITPAALQLSGGLLLVIIAMQLLTGEESDPGSQSGTLNVAAVPLGTPLLAGPGSIVALMLQMDEAHHSVWHMLAVVAGAICVLLISWITMHFASAIMRVLGRSGVALLTKLSGMLLAAIALQLMISGVLGVVDLAVATM